VVGGWGKEYRGKKSSGLGVGGKSTGGKSTRGKESWGGKVQGENVQGGGSVQGEDFRGNKSWGKVSKGKVSGNLGRAMGQSNLRYSPSVSDYIKYVRRLETKIETKKVFFDYILIKVVDPVKEVSVKFR
jgi:hypothetical protein